MPRTSSPSTSSSTSPLPAANREDDLNNRLFFRLFQTASLYEKEVQKALRTSAVQSAILDELARRPGRSMPFGEMVDYLGFSRQNLDGVLKRLERLEYVERIEDASNRRARIVRLTSTGQRAWKQGNARSQAFHRACTTEFNDTNRNALMELLGRLSRGLKGETGTRTRTARAAAR